MKGDLDKDGKLSGYEQARQDAIEKNMAEQRIKTVSYTHLRAHET